MLAGGSNNSINSLYYLHTGQSYWLMSPAKFEASTGTSFLVHSNGVLSYNSNTDSYGVRPAISLARGAIIDSGDGTATNPYVIGG